MEGDWGWPGGSSGKDLGEAQVRGRPAEGREVFVVTESKASRGKVSRAPGGNLSFVFL